MATRENKLSGIVFIWICGLLPGQLKGVPGASEMVDAPLLDRWPENDHAIPMRRPLGSHPNR